MNGSILVAVLILCVHVAAVDEKIHKIFELNLLEDYKSRENESLTVNLENEIKSRVEAFKSLQAQNGTRRQKREVQGSGVYIINGFQEAGTVSVSFPIDICLFQVHSNYYTAVLYREEQKSTTTFLKIFRSENGQYFEIYAYKSYYAEIMDCIDDSTSGYVAVVNRFGDVEDSLEVSSPVFRVTADDKVEVVLRFATPHQNSVHFWLYGEEIFLSHTFMYPEGRAASRKSCPIYKWTGHQFILIDQIKCYDSYHLEHFEIHYEVFLVVANYRDDKGVSDIFSFIYKYDVNQQTFVLHQKIFTNAAHDIRHFSLEFAGASDDFLMVENAYQTYEDGGRDYRTESVIYKFMHGYFVPFQSLVFDNVTQVLPVVGQKQEFILLVATENKEVQTFQYDGWKFVEAPINYARDAFGKGVRSMRYYNQFTERSLIAIANENNNAGDTAFYNPVFKLKNDIKTYYEKFMAYAEKIYAKYKEQNLDELLDALKHLPSITNPDLSITGRLELAHAVIHNLDTYVLSSPRITYNNELREKIGMVRHRINYLRNKLVQLQRVIAPHKTEEYVAGPPPEPASTTQSSVEPTVEESLTFGPTVSEEITQSPIVRKEGEETLTVGPIVNQEAETHRTFGSMYKESIETTTEHLTESPKSEEITETFKGISADSQVKDPKETFFKTVDQFSLSDPEILKAETVRVSNFMKFDRINGQDLRNLIRGLNYPQMHVTAQRVICNNIFVRNKIDGLVFNEKYILAKYADQEIEADLSVENLRVDRLDTPTINSKSTEEFMREQNDFEMVSMSPTRRFKKITAKELVVDGYVNGMDIRIFNDFLLKPYGDQILEAPFEIDTLKAENVYLNEGLLAGRPSDEFIVINRRNRIRQTLEFKAPLQVRQLIAMTRLNNIDVIDGRLNVLLKESNHTQIVSGYKSFENVRLTSPIILRGQINSETLQTKNPVHTFDEPLNLKGDFEINGEVKIKSNFDCQDVVGRNGQISIQRLRRYGLPLDAMESAHDFTFTQPIHVEQLRVRPSKTFNPDDFVLTATSETQYITGHKQFTGNLEIRNGFCEASEINNINLPALDRNVLKKSGDQVVDGSIHFNKISCKDTVALSTKLGQIDIGNVLTLDSEQVIPSLTVKGQMSVKSLESRNIFPRGTFNDHDLNHLIQDTVVNNEETYHLIGEKAVQHVVADSVEFPRGGRLNGIDMGAIAWDLDIFSEKYIYINETMYLQNPVKIQNLVVDGTINGIQSGEFGKVWLLSDTEQTFMEPVIVNNVEFKDNLEVTGLFNGYNLNYMHENTLWIDQDAVLGNLECEIVSAIDQVTVDGMISGLKPSVQFLLKNSTELQTIHHLSVNELLAKNLRISTCNGIDYTKLNELVFAQRPTKVKVLGAAFFHSQPYIFAINDVEIEELYENIWLMHRNTILRGQYQLNHADFATNIVSTGLVNQFNLEDLATNYFSLTRAQDIPGRFYFENGTICHHLTADSAIVGGKLRGLNRQENFINLEEFDKFSFKKGLDQEITGAWSIYQVNLKGNVENLKINELNLVDDVARIDHDHIHIPGSKFLDRLYVENLICTDACIVQDVDLLEWMANAVLTYGEYTIQSPVLIENVTVFGDFQVFGTVNGMKFDESNIFLKNMPQKINGDVLIRSKFLHENRIFPVYFKNLDVGTFNGRVVNEVLHDGVIRGHNAIVQGNLDFKSPLKVVNLYTNGHELFGINLQAKLDALDNLSVENYENQFRNLKEIGEVLQSKVSGVYLSHIKQGKSLEGIFTKFVPIIFEDNVHRLAVFDKIDATFSVQFFKFDEEFKVDDKIPPLKAEDLRLTNIERVNLHALDHLILEGEDGTMYRQIVLRYVDGELKRVWEFNSTHPRRFESLAMNDIHCMILYSDMVEKAEITCIGSNGPFLYQLLEGAPISQVVTIHGSNSDNVLILTSDGNVIIYEPNKENKLSLKQTLQLINPSAVDAICHNIHCYLAIVSDRTENAVHHGSVEIYRNFNGSDFVLLQTITSIRLPKHARFTVLASGDIVMYVLTANPAQSVIVFQYSGAAGFKEFVTSSTMPKGKEIAIVKLPAGKEYAAVLADKEIFFIEPVFNPL